MKKPRLILESARCAALLLSTICLLFPQFAFAQDTPRVVIPTTSSKPVTSARTMPTAPPIRSLYPWKLNIVTTVFWIGEEAGGNNPVPNHKSSWDQSWEGNFGGFDNPEPAARISSFSTGEFRPKSFIPRLNPFYIALPYNDKQGTGYRPEASAVIPWFGRADRSESLSTLKGRWLQIYVNNRSCYAQWEDVGPFVVDDWRYVFGTQNPKNYSNNGAGLDISPAVRDYLGIASGRKVHWRFVEASQVPYGPWKKFGQTLAKNSNPTQKLDLEAQRKYYEYLNQVRAQQNKRKSNLELQN